MDKARESNLKELEKIKNEIVQLCNMYKVEFGDNLYSGKLILRPMRCKPKECEYCPHGPYWFRATFSRNKKKFIFIYVGSKLKKAALKKNELSNWDRYVFYDKEIKRLKDKKKVIIKQLKEMEKYGI